MIYGKSTEEKQALAQRRIKEMIDGVREFALFPVKLANGKTVWLQYYYAYYRGGLRDNGTYFLWSASRDSYSPYAECSIEPDPSLKYMSTR